MDGLPPHPHPGSRAVLEPDDLYASPPPWDIGRPQPAFRALADAGEIQERVLDAGCGTGEHVLMCAALGLGATGIDLAGNALNTARQRACDRGLSARFLRHDVLRLADLGETFGTVLDCGLFHIFTDDQRAAYAASLRTALAPGGRYFMLCLSDRDPGTWGGRMRKVTRGEITATFADGWRADSIEPATVDITTGSGGIQAWLAALTRI